MQMQTRKGQQGFTIIELVVVILLLGILAATALPRFLDVTEQAHDAVFAGVGSSFVTGTALYRAEWVASGQPAANAASDSFNGLRVAPGFVNNPTNYTAATSAPAASAYTQATAFSAANRASGYPYSLSSLATLAAFDSDECIAVFDGLLQDTSSSTMNPAGTLAGTTAALIRDAVSTAQTANAADFQVFIREVSLDTGFADESAPGTPSNGSGEALNHQQQAPACVYAYSAEAGNYDRFILYAPWNGRVEMYTTADALLAAADRFDGPAVP